MPFMRSYSLKEWLGIYLIAPLATLKIIYIALIQRRDVNPVQNHRPLTGIKKCSLSKSFSVDLVKKKGKKLGFTINDTIMTVTSISIKQYFELQGDKKTNYCTLAIPFSFRPPPKQRGDFVLDNQFASMPYHFDLVSDFKVGVKLIKQGMDKAKRGWDPIGSWFAIVVTLLQPPFIANLIFTRFSDTVTFVFSNVPGPRTPIDFAGSESEWLAFLVPGLCNAAAGISIISHVDTIKVGIVADT